jgi:hypothetical protein
VNQGQVSFVVSRNLTLMNLSNIYPSHTLTQSYVDTINLLTLPSATNQPLNNQHTLHFQSRSPRWLVPVACYHFRYLLLGGLSLAASYSVVRAASAAADSLAGRDCCR